MHWGWVYAMHYAGWFKYMAVRKDADTNALTIIQIAYKTVYTTHIEAVYLVYSNCNENCRLDYFSKHEENTLSNMQTRKHIIGTYLSNDC